MKKTENMFLVLLSLVLVPLELFCAWLAYETLGEIDSVVYFIAVGVNVMFLAAAFRSRLWAAVGMILLAAIIIPYQIYLGVRLHRVQYEVARIVGYVYEEQRRTGAFPRDLSGYQYFDPGTREFIQRYTADDSQNGFQVLYRIGTTSTSHWYSPKLGWGYYPD